MKKTCCVLKVVLLELSLKKNILLRKSQSLHLPCQGEGYLPAPGKQFEISNWKSWYVIVCPLIVWNSKGVTYSRPGSATQTENWQATGLISPFIRTETTEAVAAPKSEKGRKTRARCGPTRGS